MTLTLPLLVVAVVVVVVVVVDVVVDVVVVVVVAVEVDVVDVVSDNGDKIVVTEIDVKRMKWKMLLVSESSGRASAGWVPV